MATVMGKCVHTLMPEFIKYPKISIVYNYKIATVANDTTCKYYRVRWVLTEKDKCPNKVRK